MDKLYLEELHLCIKSIEIQSLLAEGKAFTNNDKQLRRLCHCLYKIFALGLENRTLGIWNVVKVFCPRDIKLRVEHMKNNSTSQLKKNFVKDCAWLCLVLNENLLLSFFESFSNNLPLLRRYYNSSSIILSDKREEVKWLIMELEGFHFHLQINSDCFDLPAYIRRAEQEEETTTAETTTTQTTTAQTTTAQTTTAQTTTAQTIANVAQRATTRIRTLIIDDTSPLGGAHQQRHHATTVFKPPPRREFDDDVTTPGDDEPIQVERQRRRVINKTTKEERNRKKPAANRGESPSSEQSSSSSLSMLEVTKDSGLNDTSSGDSFTMLPPADTADDTTVTSPSSVYVGTHLCPGLHIPTTSVQHPPPPQLFLPLVVATDDDDTTVLSIVTSSSSSVYDVVGCPTEQLTGATSEEPPPCVVADDTTVVTSSVYDVVVADDTTVVTSSVYDVVVADDTIVVTSSVYDVVVADESDDDDIHHFDGSDDVDDELVDDNSVRLHLMLNVLRRDTETINQIVKVDEVNFLLFTNCFIYKLQIEPNQHGDEKFKYQFHLPYEKECIKLLHHQQGIFLVSSDQLSCFRLDFPNNQENMKKKILQQTSHLELTSEEHETSLREIIKTTTDGGGGGGIDFYTIVKCTTNMKETVGCSDEVQVAKRSFFGGEKWVRNYLVLEEGILYKYSTQRSKRPECVYIMKECRECTRQQNTIISMQFVECESKAKNQVKIKLSNKELCEEWFKSLMREVNKLTWDSVCTCLITNQQLLLLHEISPYDIHILHNCHINQIQWSPSLLQARLNTKWSFQLMPQHNSEEKIAHFQSLQL